MSYPDSNNKINLKTWEFILMLICVVVGLFIAYFFGYKAGHSVGYDDALAKALKNTPRFEVFEDQPKSLDKEELNKVYAKLEGSTTVPQEENEQDLDADEIQVVKVASQTADQKKAKKIDLSKFKVKVEDVDSATEKKDLLVKEEIEIARENQAKKEDRNSDQLIKEVKVIEADIEVEKPEVVKNETVKSEPESKVVEVAELEEAVEESSDQLIKSAAPSQGWYVQVTTSKARDEAKKIVDQLYGAGFKSQIEEFQIGKTRFYRILVGPENRKDYAERMVNQLSQEQFLSGKPFIRQIK